MVSVQKLLSLSLFYASYLAVAGVRLAEQLQMGQQSGFHHLPLASPPVLGYYEGITGFSCDHPYGIFCIIAFSLRLFDCPGRYFQREDHFCVSSVQCPCDYHIEIMADLKRKLKSVCYKKICYIIDQSAHGRAKITNIIHIA